MSPTPDILAVGRSVLAIETQTLQAVQEALDDRFVRAVEAIYASSGRLIITGIGKSALIGQKIVATLNSTGTPSIFMHAADAIHGDLGMVQPQDLVLCISKSGDTPEIKALVPLVRSMGNPLIALSGNAGSALAAAADYLLYTPITSEADPNNLAPTASTTAQLAMGDALAIALLALRGFSAADFARFHPGGTLGKQLYLRVRDLAALHERPAVRPDASLHAVILEMTSRRLGLTAVTDAEQTLLGVITDGDLRRMLERGSQLGAICAADIMTPQPKTISPDAMAVEALEILRRYNINQLLVSDAGRYEGVIHLQDLVREGLV